MLLRSYVLRFLPGSLRRFGARCFLLSLTDIYRASGFAAGLFVPDLRCRSTAWFFVPDCGRGFMTLLRKDDDLVRLVVLVLRRRRSKNG